MAPETSVQNKRITNVSRLISPSELRDKLALTPAHEAAVGRGRRSVTSILNGEDDRTLVIVGPCSLHDPIAGLDYAHRLAKLAERHEGELCIVMRTYFEKPRTTVGWKGLINDPHLDGSYQVNDGLIAARGFLLEVISLGLPVGCEFLDPITAEFVADAVSWGAIGARTTQSQIHRQLASGLSMPVGFKNSPDGDVQSAVDAVGAARVSQVFPGIDRDGSAAVFETTGNPDGHVVLRGSTLGPNYDEPSVADALDALERAGLPRRIVIDASHANSGKVHAQQVVVAHDMARRMARGEEGLVGIMLESFLVEGRQDFSPAPRTQLVYGQSITDECIGWDTTEATLAELANAKAESRTDRAANRRRLESPHR